VERVTEILKQVIPGLVAEKSDPTQDNRRRAVLQILAGAVGAIIAWQGKLQLALHSGWAIYVLIGAISSGGLAFWNRALDILRATKVTKEASADEKEMVAKQLKTAAAKVAPA